MIRIFLLFFAALLALIWGAAAFVLWEPNPGEWDEETRSLAVILAAIGLWLGELAIRSATTGRKQ